MEGFHCNYEWFISRRELKQECKNLGMFIMYRLPTVHCANFNCTRLCVSNSMSVCVYDIYIYIYTSASIHAPGLVCVC